MRGALFSSDKDFIDVLLYGGGWFVSCIMLYYIAFYFIKTFMLGYLRMLLLVILIASMGLYFVWDKTNMFNIYGDTYYKWIHYFMFMLQGAIIGLSVKEGRMSETKPGIELPMLVICIISFYALFSFKSSESMNFIQIFTFIPLLGVAYYSYRLCRTKGMLRLLQIPVLCKTIRTIGGLCLEIYICQMLLLNYEPLMSIVTNSFPIGIALALLAIFVTAYLLHCISNIWIQTFRDGDYDWKNVVKVF